MTVEIEKWQHDGPKVVTPGYGDRLSLEDCLRALSRFTGLKSALLGINGGVFCADSLEDSTLFFAAKAFDWISAQTIYVIHGCKFVP
jgi:hypothetical protein